LPPGLRVPGPFGTGNNPFIFSLCGQAPQVCAQPVWWDSVGEILLRYSPWVVVAAILLQPTSVTPERQWELNNISITAMGRRPSRRSGKETASDYPSWVQDYPPKSPTETCAAYASRILAQKYGVSDPRAVKTGGGSEYSQIKKACERGGW
jgi:hypothetical protein